MPNEFVARNGIIALNNSSITGSLGVSGGITGSLFGTASWASNAVTSSYILNAVSASFASTASFVNPLRQNVIITGSIQLSGSKSTFINTAANDTVAEFVAGGSTNIRFSSATVGSSAAMFIRPQDGLLQGQNYTYFNIAAASAKLKLSTDNAANPIEMQGGNVLINTSTDSGFRFDVNGTSRFTNNMLVTGSVTATSATINGAVTLYSVQKNSADQTNPLQIYNAFNSINPRIEFWGGSGARLHYNTSTRVLSPDTASGVDLGTSALNFGNVFSNTITTNTSSFFATVSGSVGIGKTTANARLDVSGSAIITGSLTVTQGITGSLLGTASLATTASNALTASFVQNAISASFASTASFVTTAQTASFVQNAVSASFAATASSADNFLVRGTLTAQTIVAQTITSSTDFVTGSTRFGSLSSNTHQFTGSVSITGSLTANVATSSFVGSITSTGNGTFGGTIVGDRGDGFLYMQGSRAAGFFIQNLLGPINLNATGSSLIGGYVTVRNSLRVYSDNDGTDGVYILPTTLNTRNRAGTDFLLIGAAETSSIKIFNNGNVLIQDAVSSGTSDPGYKFSVSGSARFRNNVEISGSFTVFTGSAVEFQVTNTGVRMGNIITDAHTVTGSFNVSGSVTATGSVNIAGGVSASGNIYQGGTGNASTVLASNGNTALVTISSTGATINMGRLGAVSLLANSTDGGIVMNDGAYLGVSSGTLRIGSNLAANNVVIGNFANSTATINGNTTISGSTVITGSFTVITGSAVEFQVTNTGVRIGNVTADVHTVTGSFNISGSGFVHGGGFIVSGTLATSGSASQGLVAPLKFTTATANTNYTLVYTDEGKMVEMNNNADAPLTVTIPLNSSVSFPIGTEISIIQIGGGTTIITGSSGVTVYSSLGVKTLQNPYDVASVVKRGTDSWYLFGNLS